MEFAAFPEYAPYIYAAMLFAMGLTIGSFLNVVVYRAPMDISLLNPPSTCPKCGGGIAARDNIPVLSWIFLGGRCRRCANPISVRYPLVELATGVLWGCTGYHLAFLPYGFAVNILMGTVALVFVSSMVVTFLIDWDHQIILDEISLGGLALSLAVSAILPELHKAETPELFALRHPLLDNLAWAWPAWGKSLCASVAGAAVGFGISMGMYYLGGMMFQEQIEAAQEEDPDIDSALGLGDVKLMAFFGALLGWQGAAFTFVAGSVLAAVAGSVMKFRSGETGGETGLAGLRNRWRSGDSVLPFGPFLVIGALVYFFRADAIRALFSLYFLPGLW